MRCLFGQIKVSFHPPKPKIPPTELSLDKLPLCIKEQLADWATLGGGINALTGCQM